MTPIKIIMKFILFLPYSASEDSNEMEIRYIWAAVTVLNYDARRRKINSLGTAQAGNVRLSTPR